MVKLALTLKGSGEECPEMERADVADAFRSSLVCRMFAHVVRQRIREFVVGDGMPAPFASILKGKSAKYRDILELLLERLSSGEIDVAEFEKSFDDCMRRLGLETQQENNPEISATLMFNVAALRAQISYLPIALEAAVRADELEVVFASNCRSVSGAGTVGKGSEIVCESSVIGMGLDGEFKRFAMKYIEMPNKKQVLSDVFPHLEFGRVYSLDELCDVARSVGHEVVHSRMKQLFMRARDRIRKASAPLFEIVPENTGRRIFENDPPFAGGGMALIYNGQAKS